MPTARPYLIQEPAIRAIDWEGSRPIMRKGARHSTSNASTASPRQSWGVTAVPHGSWLVLGRDGRLSLYACTDDGVLTWTERKRGSGLWQGPHFVRVRDLTDLTVVQGADGYVHLLGRRERRTANGSAVDLVHAIRYQTQCAVTEWRSIGSPDGDPALGVPGGVVTAEGTVHVFVRSGTGRLMLRRESASGAWQEWEDLLGADVRGVPAPVALADGRVEVGAATGKGVLVWQQASAGGRFTTPRGFALHSLPGTVSARADRSGRAVYFWTDSANGAATAWQFGGRPQPLGGSAAGHPYAVLRTRLDGYDCVLLAYRSQEGEAVLGVGIDGETVEEFWWYALGEHCQGAPALARDDQGRVVIALVDPDGVPWVCRQDADAGLGLTHWQRL